MASEFFRALELRRTQALVRRDLRTFDELHAADYQLVTPSGKVIGRAAYRAAIEDRPFYVAWEIVGEIGVRHSPAMAAVRYEARLRFPSGRVVACWHTDHYELREDRWQAVWSQATEIRAPAPTFRPLLARDQDKLWHWLHVALWDPPPAGLRPIEVMQAPTVRIYAEDWGRSTDVGIVAQVEGIDIGACWMRLLPAGVGLGSVDADTPQLGIALEPAFQHRGYGRPLMLEALAAAARAGYRQVSLTVHPDNPAMRLYERCGFRQVELRGTYPLMVARLGE